MRAAALCLFLAASPALADVQMTAAEFEAYVTGKTLTYAIDGEVDQLEQYLPGRKVRWASPEGECMTGHWYEAGDLICFSYEDNSGPHCWTYWRTEKGIMGLVAGDTSGPGLTEMARTTEPLACRGPDVGA